MYRWILATVLFRTGSGCAALCPVRPKSQLLADSMFVFFGFPTSGVPSKAPTWKICLRNRLHYRMPHVYASSIWNYATSIWNYATSIWNYATSIWNYATSIWNYATSIWNYATSIWNYATSIWNYATSIWDFSLCNSHTISKSALLEEHPDLFTFHDTRSDAIYSI